MAVTTRLDLQTSASIILGDPGNLIYKAAQVQEAIHMAMHTIRDWFSQWPGFFLTQTTTVTVASGTELYALSEHVMQINKVETTNDDGDTIQLRPIDFGEADTYRPTVSNPSGRSHAQYYYRVGAQIGFIPSDALSNDVTVYHQSSVVDLAADGTTIDMPYWMRNMIVFKVCSYCCSITNDKESKDAFERDYFEIKQMKELQTHDWHTEPQSVRGDQEEAEPIWP